MTGTGKATVETLQRLVGGDCPGSAGVVGCASAHSSEEKARDPPDEEHLLEATWTGHHEVLPATE